MAFFLIPAGYLLLSAFLLFFFTFFYLFPSLEFWLDLVVSHCSYSSFLLFVKLAFVLCFLDGASGV